MTKADPNSKIISENRKARFNYFVESRVEAGIVLTGSEVKSLRLGHVNIADAYAAQDKSGEMWLNGVHINPLSSARENHEPMRPRKLLLKKHERTKLGAAVDRAGYTLVPLKLYFNDRGIAKLELGLAKGKNAADKRDTIKGREWNRDKARLMREKG